MQFHRVVSAGHAARAQWWQVQAERILAETGFAPCISEIFITDQSSELDLVRELPVPMTSVALAIPVVAAQVPLVIDVLECDQLVSGREGEQAETTVQAILREEGFHARDFVRLSELPESQWRPHVDRAGRVLNDWGLMSFLQARAADYHWTWLGEQRDWFIQEYRLRWNLYTWNELRQRVMLFRKRGGEPAWREANEPELRRHFFEFAESFSPLIRVVPDHPDVRRILTYPEWLRVAPVIDGFRTLYENRFRYEENKSLSLEGEPLADAVHKQILEPLARLE